MTLKIQRNVQSLWKFCGQIFVCIFWLSSCKLSGAFAADWLCRLVTYYTTPPLSLSSLVDISKEYVYTEDRFTSVLSIS